MTQASVSRGPRPTARRAILVSIGTDGDVYPFIGLGDVLRERGFEVTLATHRHFAHLAKEHEFGFCSLVEDDETRALWENPQFWHSRGGPKVIARWGAQL